MEKCGLIRKSVRGPRTLRFTPELGDALLRIRGMRGVEPATRVKHTRRRCTQEDQLNSGVDEEEDLELQDSWEERAPQEKGAFLTW